MRSISVSNSSKSNKLILIFDVSLYLILLLITSVIDSKQKELNIFGVAFQYNAVCGLITAVNCLQLLYMVITYKKRGFFVACALCAIHMTNLLIQLIGAGKTMVISSMSMVIVNFITLCVMHSYIKETDKINKKLQLQADTDALTDLPNMRALQKNIQKYIDKYKKFALVFIDLDDFKMINDISGHNSGDDALKFVANELKKKLSPDDYLVRIGGDEFALIVPVSSSRENVIKHINDISGMTNQNLGLSFQMFRVTASFGVAFYPEDGRDYATLLSCADTAMYYSKEFGKAKITEYREGMMNKLLVSHEKEQLIRDAIENDSFFMMFQPQYNLHTRELRGFESLIRINRYGRVVYPGEFMSIAEKNGMILNIDRWVIKNVMESFSEVLRRCGSEILISINISAAHLLDKCFLPDLRQSLEETGFPPRCLEVEVTESVCLASVEHAVVVLNQLRDMGISLAIDDFGTGYASLNYLAKLPVQLLKIDKSFIDGIVSDEGADEFVRAIISMGHTMKMEIIAEGVEDDEQLSILTEIGCDYVQGYVWNRPVTEEMSKTMVLKLA